MRSRPSYVADCATCGDTITRMDRHLNIQNLYWWHTDDRFRYDHEAAP